MAIKIGINGMGRIGRMIVRSILENYEGKILINILTIEQMLKFVNLLKYDSIHGNFKANIKNQIQIL